jgi:hypothetical protein
MPRGANPEYFGVDAVASIRVGKRKLFRGSSFDPGDVDERQFSQAIVPILVFFVIVSSLSLASVARYYDYLGFFIFDGNRLLLAIPAMLPIASLAFVFAVGKPSLGYFLGVHFYSLIFGYMWLAPISTLDYDRQAAMVSAFLSAIAFLVPAVFIRRTAPRMATLSAVAHDRLLNLILIFGAVIVAVGAFYNFQIVGLAQMYQFRPGIEFPALFRYAVNMTSSALLPFAFACFVWRGSYGRAAAALMLFLLLYPVTLTKIALFAPVWLVFLTVLSRFFEARIAAVLSLLLPLTVGLMSVPLIMAGVLSHDPVNPILGFVNFRMFAVPSMVLDLYFDFFTKHSVTHFCQISFLKQIANCPYSDQLGIVMERAYHFGNLNGSLFAVEGVASLGPALAPLSALACGLIVGMANCVSCHLPPKVVFVSSGVLVQALVNVPFTTGLLTHGAALLFLLWYLTPGSVGAPDSDQGLRNQAR